MKLFKINIKELIVIIIFSSPLGAFLYLNNANKILIEYNFPRGYGYVHNLCSVAPDTYRAEILSEGDIQPLMNSHSGNTINMTLEVSKLNFLYKIKLKGTTNQLEAMHEKIAGLKKELNQLEANKFKDLLGDIVLHCGNASYNIYKYIPLNSEIIEENIKSRYNFGYLLFMLMCPFSIIYLFIISIKYIKNNN